MNAMPTADPKGPQSTLAAQVREAAQVSPQDLAEAERLAGLVAGQLLAAGLDRVVGLHSISSLDAVRLTED